MPDGSLRIKTKIDNSGIDKDIINLENKIKKLQTDNSIYDKQKDVLQGQINSYEELCQKADKYRNKIKQMKSEIRYYESNPIPAEKYFKYQDLGKKLASTEIEYNKIAKQVDKQASKLENVYIKLEKIKNKQVENNGKIKEYNQKLQQAQKKQFDLNYNTEGMGKSLSKGITKILKYGMALFSINSIYGLLSNAMNTWLNGNTKNAKQLKSDIDYMKNAIGGALSPILKYIVNLLYQALGFTGALIKAFTGVDIFAGSVADYMKSTTSSASKTNKELKKQLTNFDRINKLEKNDTSGGSGSGGGIATPSQDISIIMDKYAKQAEKIKSMFENIKDYVIAIGAGILAWKVSSTILELLSLLGLISKSNAIKLGISIGLMIGGAYLYYKGTKKIIDGSLESKDLLEAVIGSTLVGVGAGLMFGSLIGLVVGITLIGFALQEYTKNAEEEIIKQVCEETGLSYEDYKNKGFFDKLGFKFQLGMEILGFKESSNSITKAINDTLKEWEENIKNFLLNPLKEFLWSHLKELLSVIANLVENIPFIGQAIATGIRAVVAESKVDMEKTITETTEDAIENSAISIKKKSAESGTSVMTEMKKSMLAEKENLAKTIEETVEDATNNSKESIQKFGSTVGKFFTDDVNRIITNTEEKERLKKSIEIIVNDASKNSTGNIQEDAQNLALNLTKAIDETITDGKEKEKLKKSLVETVKYANANAETNIIGNTQELGKKITGNIETGEKSQKNSLSSNLSGVVKEANNNVDTSSSNNIGSNIVSGINKGVNNNKWSLFTTMTNLGINLLSRFKSSLDMHSPSRKMAYWSKFIPLGIAEGIDSTSNKAVNSMKDLVYNLEDTMSDIDYSNISNIPKIPRNAITYVPKQAISTNEVQRSIAGNNDILGQLLRNTDQNKEYTFNLFLDIDGEIIRKTIKKKDAQELFAMNGG